MSLTILKTNNAKPTYYNNSKKKKKPCTYVELWNLLLYIAVRIEVVLLANIAAFFTCFHRFYLSPFTHVN